MNSEKMKYYNMGLKERPKYVYTPEQNEQLENYIADKLGKFEMVYHELYSPDIHLDILVIPPSPEENYYKLVTSGMGAYKMDIPKELDDLELQRAELVMFLPPDWNLDFSKEENGWVVRQLKQLSRLPIQCNTWLTFGQTFASEDNKPLSEKAKFTGTILFDAFDKEGKELNCRLDNKEKVNFYFVYPLYKEELDYKLNNGIEKFLDLLSEQDFNFVVDVNRKNYCEKIKSQNKSNDIELEEIDK